MNTHNRTLLIQTSAWPWHTWLFTKGQVSWQLSITSVSDGYLYLFFYSRNSTRFPPICSGLLNPFFSVWDFNQILNFNNLKNKNFEQAVV